MRHFSSEGAATTRPLRSSYPQSRTRSAISQITSRTPFASSLRPNLTGGTLSRSAGGYNIGAGRVNGARYFSHGPAQPAEIVQNVSQAVRAFWLSGQKARFDGYNPKSGNKRFRALSPVQDTARHAFDISHVNSAGSFVDFKVSPTITAVGPLSTLPKSTSYTSTSNDECVDSFSVEHASAATITDSTTIANLAVDFARALKDLAAIMNDLKRLATLGDLPLALINSTTLRVRFPGCDAETVESLCRELNIRRGIVGQDEDFEAKHGAEMALLFPFAPSKTASEAGHFDGQKATKRMKRDNIDWHNMLSPAVAPQYAISLSADSHDFEFETISPPQKGQTQEVMGFMTCEGDIIDNPWLGSRPISAQLSDYSSLHPSDVVGATEDEVAMYFAPNHRQLHAHNPMPQKRSSHEDYEGLEGIYKFIEQCDHARR